MAEYTLSIIKPDAIKRNIIGKVNTIIEDSGLEIAGAKMIQMSQKMAEEFYAVHKERPFYSSLVEFMISGPVLVQVLKGENAVNRYRDIMGATNPSDAAPNTIRAELAESIEANAVHGSDSLENAKNEIEFFFNNSEIVK